MRYALILSLFLSGCCVVDHEQVASSSESRARELNGIASLGSDKLTPEFCRALAVKEADGWRLNAARARGEDVSAETRDRVGGLR